ncbi:MAG: glycosyltransferase family 4 protein [Chloroflexi bacterium]|nr:glycosyltransferase family 4 protein [Chloroflexota bacterium]
MQIRIAVNGRFAGRRITGVDRYASEILRCLGGRVRIIKPYRSLTGLRGHLWEQLILPHWISRDELLWSPANSGPVIASNQVVTVHDLTPLEHPEWFVPAYSFLYRLLFPALVRQVKCVITPSEFVRQKVMQRFSLSKDRVVAIREGVNMERFRWTDSLSVRARYQLPQKYILFIGSLQPRKNLSALIDAWNLVKDDSPKTALVVVGSAGRVFRRIELPNKTERVVFLGYVADDELPALYSGASVYVLPSIEEGFGLTMLEAMACGTPVIASNGGALPEVAGDAALLVNPLSVSQIAAALNKVLLDEGLRLEFRAKGLERASRFTWGKSAKETWDVFARYA